MTNGSYPDHTQGDINKTQDAKVVNKKVSGTPIEGQIAQTIGTGEHAKNSFVWLTIRWSFIVGAATTAAIYIKHILCQTGLQTNLIDDIKSTWNIFLPIITLALGYAFGKGK